MSLLVHRIEVALEQWICEIETKAASKDGRYDYKYISALCGVSIEVWSW